MDTTERFLPEFIQAYKNSYGVELNQQDAEEEFAKILSLYKTIYLAKMPLPQHPAEANPS